MRGRVCVPMILLCLLLSGCGAKTADQATAFRRPYQKMTGCEMKAKVTCGVGSRDAARFTLRCTYVPGKKSTVEILEPKAVSGVRAEVDGKTLTLLYDGKCLNAGTLSRERISPAQCLPLLMDTLRNGWLLEQNPEKRGTVPCVRLSLDETGKQGGKIVSTVWLRQKDGLPVCGEVAVDGKIILRAEFTEFQFGDILST